MPEDVTDQSTTDESQEGTDPHLDEPATGGAEGSDQVSSDTLADGKTALDEATGNTDDAEQVPTEASTGTQVEDDRSAAQETPEEQPPGETQLEPTAEEPSPTEKVADSQG